MTKLKILQVNDFLKGGGAEEIFRFTTRGLKKKHISIEYFVSEFSRTPRNAWEYLYNSRVAKEFGNILANFQPNIIHFHNFYHLFSIGGFLALKKYKNKNPNLKIVYTTHDFFAICPNPNFYSIKNGVVRNYTKFKKSHFLLDRMDARGFFYSFMKKIQWLIFFHVFKIQKLFDQIISPSIFVKEIFYLNNFKNTPIQVVRNPYLNPDNPRSRESKPNQSLKLVFLGRIVHDKGLAGVFKAINLIRDDLNVHLDIYGDGPFSTVLKRLISEMDLGDFVSLKGYLKREEISKVLTRYDALINSSLCYETSSLILVEGAMNGLKLLVSNHGAVKETAEICLKSFFFDPFSPVSISNAIIKCFNEETELDDNLRLKRLNEIYSQRKYLAQIESVYKQLLR